MKYISLAAGILGIVMMAVVAQGADKTIAWDAVPAADGYRISISVDSGATWQQVSDVPVETTQVVVIVPDAGLTLIRASSYTNIGEVTNTISGVWFNPDWTLAQSPASLRTPGE